MAQCMLKALSNTLIFTMGQTRQLLMLVPACAQETTLMHHIWAGYERMQNVCSVCGAASCCFAPFTTLPVEIEPDTRTLEDALARRACEHLPLLRAALLDSLPGGGHSRADR